MSAGRPSARRRSKSRPILVWLIEFLKIFAIDVGVLVAASGKIDDEQLAFSGRCAAEGFGDSVSGLQCGNDALHAGQGASRFERAGIGSGDILGAALIAQPSVFGADQGVVEARGYGVGEGDLAFGVLQQITVSAVEDAGCTAGETRGVRAQLGAATARFDSDQLDGGVVYEGVKHSDGVASAADAGEDRIRQTALALEDLPARFIADDAVKIANHHGVGVRAERGAEQVMRAVDVGDPIAHSFADGILEGAAAGSDADNFRAQHAHAEDVQALAAHVFLAHVDDALESEKRADGGGGDAVLSRAGFGDDALLAHAAGEQRLAQAVVDLVGAGVEQVFALDVDCRATRHLGEAFGVIERRGAAGVVGEQVLQFGLKFRILARGEVGLLEFFERGHQDLGNVAATVRSEMSGRVWLRRGHAASATLMNVVIFSWSFTPGDFSRREQASTPQGWASWMAWRTLETSRPPAITIFPV